MTLCIDEGVTSKLQAVIAQLFSSLQLFALCKQKKPHPAFSWWTLGSTWWLKIYLKGGHEIWGGVLTPQYILKIKNQAVPKPMQRCLPVASSSSRTRPGGILVKCPKHLNWLLFMWRISGSTLRVRSSPSFRLSYLLEETHFRIG